MFSAASQMYDRLIKCNCCSKLDIFTNLLKIIIGFSRHIEKIVQISKSIEAESKDSAKAAWASMGAEAAKKIATHRTKKEAWSGLECDPMIMRRHGRRIAAKGVIITIKYGWRIIGCDLCWMICKLCKFGFFGPGCGNSDLKCKVMDQCYANLIKFECYLRYPGDVSKVLPAWRG